LHIALIASAWLLGARAAQGQITITEIMFDPLASADAAWEWVEIHNAGGSPIDLNGWVFGDEASRFSAANIVSLSPGDTVIPAGRTAVIYEAGALDSDPTRFTAAWGGGIRLIPTSAFPSLNNGGDRIGLWSSHASYGTTTGGGAPVWANAAAQIDYSPASGFPTVTSPGGPSIAWNGMGSATGGANWMVSMAGQPGARTAAPTMVQINDTADAGTPGNVPAGAPPAGKVIITEIMYNPQSSVGGGGADAAFEWIEVLNNTGAPINFAGAPYVLDDLAGADLDDENVTTGSVPNGSIAVLFNASLLTADELKAAWQPNVGVAINFIPVNSWPGLNNGPESVGLWDSLADYASEHALGPAFWNDAAAAVSYSDNVGDGWPADDGNGSIYLNNLSANPALAGSWTLSGGPSDAFGAFHPDPIMRADHPGGDVGSPGFVPGVAPILFGDYNGDSVVGAGDYTVWRNNLHAEIALLNEDPMVTPGMVTIEDYYVWKENYGEFIDINAAANAASAPEPATLFTAICGALWIIAGFGSRLRLSTQATSPTPPQRRRAPR
jgi:hypothetical protein